MAEEKQESDENLVHAAKAGEMEAFDLLISRYEKRVINLCFRHLRQYEESCDLAQDIFIQVFEHLKDFKEQSSFSTWVYRVSLNACYNRQRWKRAKGRNKTDSLEGMLERRQAAADSSPLMRGKEGTPLDHLVTKEIQEQVWQAMNELKMDFRKVVQLVDIEGLPYEEAAAVLEIPVNTVRSRLSRARTSLKKTLQKYQRKND